MKGLFYRHTMRPLLLATGTIVSALMLDYVFNITGNSKYMTKQLLIVLGQPAPNVISAYEHTWTEDEWSAWLKRRRGGGARGGGEEE